MPKARRIIVIDACSTDDTADIAETSHPNVEVIRNTEDFGLAAATNQGLALADTDYILNINPDTIIDDGCVERLIAMADANPNAAGVAPLLTNNRGNLELDVMGPAERHHHKLGLVPEGPFCTWFITGAVVLWRRSAVQSLGGWDGSFFLYSEDADLSYRSTRAGFSLILEPRATADHFGGASEKITLKTRRRKDWNMAWGHLHYERKHGAPGDAETAAGKYVKDGIRGIISGILKLSPKRIAGNYAKLKAARQFLRGDPPWSR